MTDFTPYIEILQQRRQELGLETVAQVKAYLQEHHQEILDLAAVDKIAAIEWLIRVEFGETIYAEVKALLGG